jgi:hypothetical protein
VYEQIFFLLMLVHFKIDLICIQNLGFHQSQAERVAVNAGGSALAKKLGPVSSNPITKLSFSLQ